MTKRTPIGIHNIMITTTAPGTTTVGLYKRTVYTRLDGTFDICFQDRWIKAVYAGDDDVGPAFTAELVYTPPSNIKGKKLAKSSISAPRG